MIGDGADEKLNRTQPELERSTATTQRHAPGPVEVGSLRVQISYQHRISQQQPASAC